MVEFVMLILGVALFLYVVLGGADFGAGIIEIFTGNKGINTISRAIAPVWEANHVWLILVIVVVFNGFPKVFSTLSITLHIPLFIVLIGMVLRGTAFTFRHYDVVEDSTHKYYHFFFRISSLITPFFLGVTLGAMILGKITMDYDQGFYKVFIAPWLNSFTFALGAFSTVLFSYISAMFLVAEVETETSKNIVLGYARFSLIALVFLGALVMLTAQWNDLSLFSQFINNPISLVASILATLMIPYLFFTIKKQQINIMRIGVGAQAALIMIGWAAVQFPDFIKFANGTSLNMYNTAAPLATFRQLTIALIVGMIIIIPAFLYLFKVFKFDINK